MTETLSNMESSREKLRRVRKKLAHASNKDKQDGERLISKERDVLAFSEQQKEAFDTHVLAPNFKGVTTYKRSDEKKYHILKEPLPLKGRVCISELCETLFDEFPHMEHVIDKVYADLFLIEDERDECLFRISPLLLIGPPGSTKSSFAERLAKLCGMPYQFVSCGTASEGMGLGGTDAAYGAGHPSVMVEMALANQTANGLLLVDEIDKGDRGFGNSDQTALISILGNEKRFADQYVGPVDLKYFNFVLTANSKALIHPALLDRCNDGIEVALPGPEFFDRLVTNIIREFREEYGKTFDLTSEQMDRLRHSFKTDGSIRKLKNLMILAFSEDRRPRRRPYLYCDNTVNDAP